MANDPQYDPWYNNLRAKQAHSPGGVPPQQTAGLTNTAPQSAPIPGAGIYAQQQNLAEKAYQDAVAQLQARRNSLYHEYGLNNKGAVDPMSQFGEYQQLLGSEGGALDAADNASLDRGLGTGGLAMQGETGLRGQQGAENLAFQRQVAQVGQDYASGVLGAQQQRSSSMLEAQQTALANALAAGDFTPVDMSRPETSQSNGGVSWGGQTFTQKSKLAKWLAAHGEDYAGWARNHPGAAAKLK